MDHYLVQYGYSKETTQSTISIQQVQHYQVGKGVASAALHFHPSKESYA
jgi:hypothetical protein